MSETGTEVVLQTIGLTRRYGPVIALDALDLEIRAGECVVMMGPNGSGKTTAAELICGLREPSEGQVHVCGYSMLEEPSLCA